MSGIGGISGVEGWGTTPGPDGESGLIGSCSDGGISGCGS